ncbi:hypothetical protein KR009_008653, partial [Drosophila setifemur]
IPKILIFLFPAIVCLFVAVEAQRPSQTCANIHARCLRAEPRNGRTNDLSDIFNNWCRWGPRFTNRGITRCELVRATCICKYLSGISYFFKLFIYVLLKTLVTIDRCRPLSCEEVKRTLE